MKKKKKEKKIRVQLDFTENGIEALKEIEELFDCHTRAAAIRTAIGMSKAIGRKIVDGWEIQCKKGDQIVILSFH